ncbi:hypothetical protein JR316_0000165 [Psilocybe cubensis]|uniref:Uncharacterized protein n=2 Tax=Psilocybe cubensis TaxID=181762 RepID=A0A8H7Y6U2_PSICU|nr:hypothetical protein JR316_0000165 [Psilocybe cubensis]KAH9486101.1 hypothetical protein JR316_0000165 [Psilocybe cubensis]
MLHSSITPTATVSISEMFSAKLYIVVALIVSVTALPVAQIESVETEVGRADTAWLREVEAIRADTAWLREVEVARADTAWLRRSTQQDTQ